MWKCHKCGKPVYFAERKQSLGYDWHPECLRCEECGKRLNPGQHAEHKGVPYCHVPCYGALFGPQLFGHGTRVESHKSFGNKTFQRPGQQNGPSLPRDHLESKLKVYNQFYDNKSMEVRSREVNNRLILEGALRVYWGVQGVIHLKEDDDQRTFVVRKRNSCRMSKADSSDKENNDGSESLDVGTTTSDQVDAISTDISLTESMSFDSCSLNEFPDLPTTPEDASANTTGTQTLTNGGGDVGAVNGGGGDDTSSTNTSTLCDDQCSSLTTTTTMTTNGVSSTLPSKLDKLVNLEWDEIDDLLQVERRVSEKDKIYETMPVRLPSTSPQNSSSSTPTSDSSKTVSNQLSTDTTNLEDITSSKNSTTSSSPVSSPSSATTSNNTTSSDNFLTATGSMATTTTSNSRDTTTTNATTSTTTVDNYETSDDATLKPMDFEDFKRSVHQDYVNGANSFQEHNDDTLKRNQPIDPSRIHDSLKLYSQASGGDNPMSKSFNCEHALRSIDASFINDTLALRMSAEGGGSPQKRSPYVLQKSGSAQAQLITNGRFEKGINRSKSGPSCMAAYSSSDDDDDDSTLKPQRRSAHQLGPGDHISATIRKSDIPPRFIQINMNCYPKESGQQQQQQAAGSSECDSSRQENAGGQSTTSQSGAAAGDELTQTEEMFTATGGDRSSNRGKYPEHLDDDDQPLHVTEDGVVLRRPPRTGAAAIKRRSGNRRSRTKLKRRCSINGHFYNRETSFFTPPYGSQMSVWVTSLVTTQEVINLLLEKYKVDSPAENFSLFIIRDNGEQKRLKENEYPLITRIMLGPHEDVAKLFLVDAKKTDEISNEVAQFLNLSLPECRAILERYDQELEREVTKVKDKYAELRRRIVARMESLKVHL